jgi:protease PrsW
MNVPRNVSIFKVMQLMFIGGIASLFLALIFFSNTDFLLSWMGASSAGIVEETAKLLIVALLMGRTTRYPWVLNGMLFGAAIGCGFGAFESAGYAFRDMLSNNSVDHGMQVMMLRAILAPFMHIVWTANSAGALWIVKRDKPFTWDMLAAPAFLRVMISSMVIHMIWNAPFNLVELPFGFDLKNVILGLLSWIICFRLVQTGLKQLNEARQQLKLPDFSRGTVRPA